MTLADELDQAISTLQAARKLIAEMQRAGITVGRILSEHRGADAERTGAPPSLRHAGMTVAEAAEMLQISEEHVRRLLRRGDLVGVPFGGHVGWRLSRDYVAEVAAHWAETREAKRAARTRVGARAAKKPATPRKPAKRTRS